MSYCASPCLSVLLTGERRHSHCSEYGRARSVVVMGDGLDVILHLNEVRYLISALGSMAAEMAGVMAGDTDDEME